MQERQSRMDKYFDAMDEEVDTNTGEMHIVSSRLQKNQELYKEVGSLDIDDFDLNSNVSILGDNTANINLDDIQQKLDKKYHVDRKDKVLGIDDDAPLPKINLDETREYDINNILAKAKEEKEIDYEEDRLKKLRNTQYDILKNLDIEEKPLEDKPRKNVATREEEEQKLKDLIDTITAKELIKNEQELEVEGDMDPLDILSDLKGDDDNTKVMGAVSLDEEVPEDDVVDSDKLSEAIKEEFKDEEEVEETPEEVEEETEEPTKEIPSKKNPLPVEDTDTNIDTTEITTENSFIGDTSPFTTQDFDDFQDLKDDMKASKIFVRVMIVLLIIVFIVGVVILLNKYLNLGLF